MYGIRAPAPICTDPATVPGAEDCQVVLAPATAGERLVPDRLLGGAAAGAPGATRPSEDTEIRLTYRELAALIEDAVRAIR
jgi:hypothetical protein